MCLDFLVLCDYVWFVGDLVTDWFALGFVVVRCLPCCLLPVMGCVCSVFWCVDLVLLLLVCCV